VFETADRRLEAKVKELFDGEAVEVSFGPPGPGKTARGVGLHLIEAAPAPALSTSRRPPLQATLRYQVSAWADTPLEAHRLLGETFFAALEWPDVEVEGAPPTFALRVLLRRERPEPPVKRVRHPLTFRPTPMGSLSGVVVGPGDLPLSGARVEVPWLEKGATTGADGRFVIDGVPSSPPVKRLKVSAKGLEMTVDLPKPAAGGEPLKIRMNGLEE
jgi:hypothetical protein